MLGCQQEKYSFFYMRLETFIKKNNLTWEAFADMAGITRQTVYNLMRRHNKPRFDTIEKIDKATKGEVSASDFL